MDVGVYLKVGFWGGLHLSRGKYDRREAGGYPAVSSTRIEISVAAQEACSITHMQSLSTGMVQPFIVGNRHL